MITVIEFVPTLLTAGIKSAIIPSRWRDAPCELQYIATNLPLTARFTLKSGGRLVPCTYGKSDYGSLCAQIDIMLPARENVSIHLSDFADPLRGESLLFSGYLVGLIDTEPFSVLPDQDHGIDYSK